MSDPILTLKPSPARRWLGLLSLAVIGVLIIYLAIASPPSSTILQALAVTFGLFILYMTHRHYHATEGHLVLTQEGIAHSIDGHLCAIADVVKVERGLFALKPSGGFVLHLNQPIPRRWRPGVYWSFGQRIGVGGIIDRNQAKMVAEHIASIVQND